MCGGGSPASFLLTVVESPHLTYTPSSVSPDLRGRVSGVPPVQTERGPPATTCSPGAGAGGGRLAPASRPTAHHGCCAQCLPPSPAHRCTPGESFLPKCVLATSDRATNHPKTRWLKTTHQSPCSRGGTEHFLCFLWSRAGHSGDGKSKAAWSTAGRGVRRGLRFRPAGLAVAFLGLPQRRRLSSGRGGRRGRSLSEPGLSTHRASPLPPSVGKT